MRANEMNSKDKTSSVEHDPIIISPSPQLIGKITRHLQQDGVYCLENALNKNTLRGFQNEINTLIESRGKRYFSLINLYKDQDSSFNVLDMSANLKELLKGLADSGTKEDLSSSEILNVLRIVTGENVTGQSLRFHYDATMITALIPVLIPDGPVAETGHLVTFRNLRQTRDSALVNILEKIMVQNMLIQKIFSFFVMRNLDKHIVKIKEGNIYFFYGYRTLHANLAVNPKFTRATLLFHFGDLHNDSFLVRSIATFRHWREKRNSEL
jgi:hypothetical protein